MIRLLFLLCVLSFPSLNAGIEDHFKKVGDKSGLHSMQGIDFIYMINLDQRPEKFARSIEQLAPFGIYPHRFSAVNGWELSLKVLNNLGVKYSPQMKSSNKGTCYLLKGDGQPYDEVMRKVGRAYFNHGLSRGAIGCVLSHLSVIQDAYDSGYETVWIMEDDIEIIQDPHLVSGLIDELDVQVGKGNWDVLFTDK